MMWNDLDPRTMVFLVKFCGGLDGNGNLVDVGCLRGEVAEGVSKVDMGDKGDVGSGGGLHAQHDEGHIDLGLEIPHRAKVLVLPRIEPGRASARAPRADSCTRQRRRATVRHDVTPHVSGPNRAEVGLACGGGGNRMRGPDEGPWGWTRCHGVTMK